MLTHLQAQPDPSQPFFNAFLSLLGHAPDFGPAL